MSAPTSLVQTASPHCYGGTLVPPRGPQYTPQARGRPDMPEASKPPHHHPQAPLYPSSPTPKLTPPLSPLSETTRVSKPSHPPAPARLHRSAGHMPHTRPDIGLSLAPRQGPRPLLLPGRQPVDTTAAQMDPGVGVSTPARTHPAASARAALAAPPCISPQAQRPWRWSAGARPRDGRGVPVLPRPV